jgi:hypothetical protein
VEYDKRDGVRGGVYVEGEIECLIRVYYKPASAIFTAPQKEHISSDITMTSRSLRPVSAFRGRSIRDMDNLHRPSGITSRGGGKETNMVEMPYKAAKRHLVSRGI